MIIGRRFLDIEPVDLTNDLIYQTGAIQAIAKSVEGEVRYVKPHGALYSTIVHNVDLDPDLAMLVLPNSEVQKAAHRAGYAQ